MNWTFDGEKPIYAQLVEHIERAVVSGVMPPGSRLPTVREMASDAGVNPNTMQRALSELEARGLVYAQRTAGRFVTEDAGRLDDVRGKLATAYAKNFVRSVRALGCGGGEVDLLVKRAKEEEGYDD